MSGPASRAMYPVSSALATSVRTPRTATSPSVAPRASRTGGTIPLTGSFRPAMASSSTVTDGTLEATTTAATGSAAR